MFRAEAGAVVPIPIFPVLPLTNNLLVNTASPPTEDWIFRLPPFNSVKVLAGFAPVGTASARLLLIDAVGVPVALLMNANLADEVLVPPMRTSRLVL